jgi:iron complex outermembrane receptor protein
VIVTAAAKHPQLAQDAPSSVTVITGEEIRRLGYRTLIEVLRSVRGFYSSYDRNYSSLGVRGFLRPTDYNDRILLLVNGHTYNDDVYQIGYFGPEFGIDLEAVKRIEVIRGPGSALYGGNALFAVINVVTVDGKERPGARPIVETGSYGRKRGQMTAGHVFQNGVDLFVSGSVLDVDGQDELFYPAYDSPETHNGIAHDVDGEQALNFFSSSHYQNVSLQAGVNWRKKHIPTGSFGTTFNDTGTKTIDGRQFAELLYAAEPFADIRSTARVFYDGVRYHGTYIYGSGADRIKNQDLYTSHWVGGEIRGEREMFSRNTLTIGTEYTYHPDAHQENFDQGGESFLDDHRSYGTVGVYGQDEWEVLRHVTLVGGARYDHYYNGLEQVSPRVATIWSPRDTTRAKFLYGRAFRPPNLFELYFDSGSLGVVGNPSIDPERMTTYEGTIEQEVWIHIQTVATVFHWDIDDLVDQTVVPGPEPGSERLQFRNVSSVRATGGELELRAPLPHAMSARASYTLVYAKIEGGGRLTNSPRHLGNVALLFPLPYGVEGGAELVVVGPRLTIARETLSTVTLANLSLILPTPFRRLQFGAGFYNLLNQKYSDPGGSEHRQDRIPQDRFTFRVDLRYFF